MEDKSLLQQLTEHASGDSYPFHMPGHKRNPRIDYIPAGIDITEIEGFDNLHHACGVLRQAQQRAAQLYGASESYFLVNGSTGGILSAVSACVKWGGSLLMARNCHKAAYHAALLRGLKLRYVYPEILPEYGICGCIPPEAVRCALEEDSSIQAVFLTSPTYEGMLSDIEKIVDIVHRYGRILIVDEAHGAHLGIGGAAFQGSAVTAGADIVIQSLHKTLPSMTQTAILHVLGERVDRKALRRYLQIYQSSSPSYVFMAGMDSCIRLLEQSGAELFEAYAGRLEAFYERARSLRCLEVLQPAETGERPETAGMDASKICIFTTNTGITGKELYMLLLNRYGLQLEMAAGNYALAMTSIMDTQEGFDRLSEALEEIDDGIWRNMTDCDRTVQGRKQAVWDMRQLQRADAVMRISEAEDCPGIYLPFSESIGRISKEFRYVYPPGVPVLVPGEVITPAVADRIQEYEKQGLEVLGAEQKEGTICVAESGRGE